MFFFSEPLPESTFGTTTGFLCENINFYVKNGSKTELEFVRKPTLSAPDIDLGAQIDF